MIEARRRAYLEAMGFDVWVRRGAADLDAVGADECVDAGMSAPAQNHPQTTSPTAPEGAAGRLRLTPGEGSTLVVCAEAADSASRFAGDLARALGATAAEAPAEPGCGAPVWAWPEAGGEDCLTLEEAIRARLITRVVLLGPGVIRRVLDGEPPRVIGSAVVIPAAGLEELAVSGLAKQRLWKRLRGRTDGAETERP